MNVSHNVFRMFQHKMSRKDYSDAPLVLAYTLLLYHPHSCHEELFPNDLEKCKELYKQNLNQINYVKSIVMPPARGSRKGLQKLELTRDSN